MEIALPEANPVLMTAIALAIASAVTSPAVAQAEPSATCLAASRRFVTFYIEEAKGTRHEAQIADSIKKSGSIDKKVIEMAAGLKEAQCNTMLVLPDSSVRAMAISSLPERNGK